MEGKYPVYSVKMDPQQAQELTEKGGALLVLDMPEGSSFGIDQQVRCLIRYLSYNNASI